MTAAPQPARKIVSTRYATVTQITYDDGTGDLADVVTKEPAGLRIVGNGTLQSPLSVEAINPAAAFRTLLAAGLTRGEVRNIMAESDQENFPAFIQAARDEYATTDELEIDDTPEVSEGDRGAWVAAWVWVSNDLAGVPTEPDEFDL